MGVRDGRFEEADMINPASVATTAVVVLALVLIGPAPGFAQSKLNERPNEHAVAPPRPPMRAPNGAIVGSFTRPIVAPFTGPIVGPIGTPARGATQLPPSVPNHPFDHDRDHDRDHDHDRGRDNNRGAFAAGVATGIVIGGALATPPPGVYSVQPPSPTDDPVGYCVWMYSSYDPKSGTYIGNDGNPHPCP
jgi:hypothetical protein